MNSFVTGCYSFKTGQREHFWVGGRCHPHGPSADEIMTSSVFFTQMNTKATTERLFTTLIQHEVILVTELLWATCDEDVLLSKKILKAHDLRLEGEKVISSIRCIRASECLFNGFRVENLMIKEPKLQIQPLFFKKPMRWFNSDRHPEGFEGFTEPISNVFLR